jgi:hypothetical protein
VEEHCTTADTKQHTRYAAKMQKLVNRLEDRAHRLEDIASRIRRERESKRGQHQRLYKLKLQHAEEDRRVLATQLELKQQQSVIVILVTAN